jgi:hypothetical protein
MLGSRQLVENKTNKKLFLVRLKKSFGGEEVDHDGGVVSGEDR